MFADSVNHDESESSLFAKVIFKGVPVKWLALFWLTILVSCPGTGPRSAVGNVSGYRCVSDCRSRGCEFDPGPILSCSLIMK